MCCLSFPLYIDAVSTAAAVSVMSSQVDAMSSSSSVHGESLSPMLEAAQHATSSSPHLGNMVSNGEGDNASELSSTVGAGELGLESGDSTMD